MQTSRSPRPALPPSGWRTEDASMKEPLQVLHGYAAHDRTLHALLLSRVARLAERRSCASKVATGTPEFDTKTHFPRNFGR